MAIIRRYPLNSLALDELIGDFEKLYYGLPEVANSAVERATQHAQTDFDYFLSAATSGRQAVITTSTRTRRWGKYGAVGTLTATGKTEDTGFNILFGVEFGAGIAYNWGVGNTDYSAMGMGVGTWPGQTHAYDFEGWTYFKDEEFHHTYGTPATMPMHRTIMDTRAQMSGFIVEEIRKWLV